MNPAIRDEVLAQMAELPENEQRRVIEFARALAMSWPRGVAGSSLLPFAGLFDAEDVAQITAAIEAECERVDDDAW